MSLHGVLAAECLRWGALCFAGEIGWERSKHYRTTSQTFWPWALLFGALAIGQLTICFLYPQQIYEAFAAT